MMSEAEVTTPKPRITPTGRPFWDALAKGEVHIQRCGACQHYVFYPRTICPDCSSRDLAWTKVSGKGVLYTYTVTEPGKGKRGGDILAIVELDVGVRLATTLVGIDPDAVQVGVPVEPVFDDETFGDVTLLRFRPAG
jgi:uncharacterized OB-fold protein